VFVWLQLIANSTVYSLIERLPESDSECVRQAQEAQRLVEQLSQEIRTTSYLLHPPMLDELGLSSALRWYVEGFEKRSGIKTYLELGPSGQRLPAELESAIFRTIQEALTNIHRHAGSPTAFIRLQHDSDNVVLEIQDQGKGIERSQLNQISAGMASSVGLQGMRERVWQFGGDLQFLSDDHGLTIKAVIPLPSRRSAIA
jgi:signal transduction histidine kinase